MEGGPVVKLSDVARRAGVSSGTASRVINGTGNVSPPRAEAVERAVRELDYRPNMVARSLRRQRSQTLGLVVPDVTNAFFSELALSVEIAAARQGYSVILGNSANSNQIEGEYLRNLVDRQVDGLIVVPSDDTRGLSARVQGTPLVVVDRDISVPGADFVGADHKEGARQMVSHLVSLGHRRIGCIATAEGGTLGRQRHSGYAEIAAPLLEEAGLDAVDYVWRGTFSFESGMAGARYLLQLNPPPTAIFANNDQQAIGAMRQCMDAGIRIPQDISVAGYDDIPLASFISPRLSTVKQPINSIGEQAVRWLLERIELEKKPRRRSQRQPTTLKIRESCAPFVPH
jgi:LacI family transcriptional regulator